MKKPIHREPAATGKKGLQDRKALARNAAYEIDALTNIIAREHVRAGDDCTLVLPSMMRRIKDLASVVMSVTGADDGRTTEEMHGVVFGEVEGGAV